MEFPFLYPAGSFSWGIALGATFAVTLIIVATVVLHRTIARWENRRFRQGREKAYDKI
jgi:hypothetical protein